MSADEQGAVEKIAAALAERLGDRDDRPLLTFRGVADRLGMSESTAQKLIARRVLPSIVVAGGGVRVKPADLDAYIASRPVRNEGDDDGE